MFGFQTESGRIDEFQDNWLPAMTPRPGERSSQNEEYPGFRREFHQTHQARLAARRRRR